MKFAVDLAVLWMYCLAAAVFVPVDIPFVVGALAAVVYACGCCLAHSGRVRFGFSAVFLALSAVCLQLLMFVPLVFYVLLDGVLPAGQGPVRDGGPGGDYRLDARGYVVGCAVCCFFAAVYVSSEEAVVCFAAVGCVIGGRLQYHTGGYRRLDAKYRRTRDDSVEMNLLLREKNQSILEKQDYEVYTATLRERNRIAREIHDNVGHMLSRSILMVGAMKAVHGEGNLKEPLAQLEDTLNGAMTSVRRSVHDLHDEAINLKEVLESLMKDFTFCQASLEYDMGYDVPRNLRYGFIAIVKEALNNVMKHSNATEVQVTAREHPGLYQLIVEDNGTPMAVGLRKERGLFGGGQEENQGIGIRNMKERVDTFGGNLEIRTQGGWRIYITVPKTS